MNTSRSELTSEQALMGIKKLSAEISAFPNDVEIEKKQHLLDILVNKFWDIVENNSVINTRIPPDDNNEREVTFVCRGNSKSTEKINLFGDFLKPGNMPVLEKIPGTNIYAYNKNLANNLRTEFILLKSGDDLGKKWEGDRYVLSMPNARPQRYVPGYDLALMSSLPNKDENKAEKDIIYLADDGQYVVRDPQGLVKKGKVDTTVVDISNIATRLNESTLKSAILKETSKAGHTHVPSRELAKLELQNMESEGRFFRLTIDEDGPYKGREYWVHLPENYNNKQKPPYSLLLCLDGQEYHSHIPTPSIMDRMIEDNAIKPTITVLLANKGTEDRFEEYNCDMEFTDFLAKKFIPIIQEQFHISRDPNDATIAGSSMGGLGAIYTGLTHPKVFGNVISLSGSLWKADEITPSKQYKTTTGERLQTAIDNFPSKNCKLKIEMKAGTSENDDWARPKKVGEEEPCRSMLKSNHDFAEIMNAKGIQADCKEFPGGHNDACWQGLLSEGLTHKSYQEEAPQKTNTDNLKPTHRC
ncbi:MAG: hypothetical protein A3F11_09635 [Gammaproteobacteria bacterium RIFCSPHIGHO2_12_FULL_37_14]|nr:MAG: hypothetical protein A3F11_09635 [Gammaproteobacteria bacterium RIFCSPHIGHO2_12_FULL_37_14]